MGLIPRRQLFDIVYPDSEWRLWPKARCVPRTVFSWGGTWDRALAVNFGNLQRNTAGQLTARRLAETSFEARPLRRRNGDAQLHLAVALGDARNHLRIGIDPSEPFAVF